MVNKSDYKEDLTIYEEDLVGYIDRPKGVEFSTIQDLEKDSNWLLFTGISYLGAGLIGGTVGIINGVYTPNVVISRFKTILRSTHYCASRSSNITASTVFTFGLFKRIISTAFKIHEEGIIASTVSGASVGILLSAPKGFIRSGISGSIGGVLGFLSSLTSRSVVTK
ncbi:hypothetical protein DICPUDRAFT_97574 [Dictyostelium purpureum]|uniref:Mitochondrial import inner membrane translocase subunit TIM22 n=1 Tax=Dictyostelium purpureum TaxID=5786 RepID=F0ZHW0_DICPU|nr:uncharacterized protein DICPUDRAFT_97574 [Dictyostelium purpureum]EGC36491.1 hypothetical protein DICPUDRAFT_97574 [Dictyostelium purpureum]|eukprot:XP_003287004.1 hypothetical protein DICPUDRAFT_97574 [Dictyostelium purpureum]